MACWPWIVTWKRQGIPLARFANVLRWYEALKERPALRRGYELGRELRGG
jgi:GST-like protein